MFGALGISLQEEVRGILNPSIEITSREKITVFIDLSKYYIYKSYLKKFVSYFYWSEILSSPSYLYFGKPPIIDEAYNNRELKNDAKKIFRRCH